MRNIDEATKTEKRLIVTIKQPEAGKEVKHPTEHCLTMLIVGG